MLLLAFLSNSFTITRAQVQAQPVAANESANSIRFVRMEGDMLVFELRLINLPPKGSKLRILDGDNNTLLEERISTETYNIRYKIVRGDISKINFEVSGKKVFLNQSFNVRSRTEEKIEVTELSSRSALWLFVQDMISLFMSCIFYDGGSLADKALTAYIVNQGFYSLQLMYS